MAGKAETYNFDLLPIGYRFCPSDVDLIVRYLSNKVHRLSLPPNQIIEIVNLYAHHPDQLAEIYEPQGRDEWFYFTQRDSGRDVEEGGGYWMSTGSHIKIKEDDTKMMIGCKRPFWKATGSDRQIKDDDDEEEDGRKIIGYKRPFVFYHKGVIETDWIMHEFTLADNDGNLRMDDDCVLCMVYKKDKSERRSKK